MEKTKKYGWLSKLGIGLFSLCVVSLFPVTASAQTKMFGEYIVTGADLSGCSYELQENNQYRLSFNKQGSYTVAMSLGAEVRTNADIVVNADHTVLTLDNVTIYGDGCPALTVKGTSVKIILADGSNNVLFGGTANPGCYLYPPEGELLEEATVITCEHAEKEEHQCTDFCGSLYAYSAQYGAGIGGGYEKDCGAVRIEGGNIWAVGSDSAAGIGGGYKGQVGSIAIHGGNITAYGGTSAAGIGVGSRSYMDAIYIGGGQIHAYGGDNAPGIGCGLSNMYSYAKNIYIYDGVITAMGGQNHFAIFATQNVIAAPDVSRKIMVKNHVDDQNLLGLYAEHVNINSLIAGKENLYIEGLPSGDTLFRDVKATDYFYEPVCWAVDNGITAGITMHDFSPNMPCTRGQAVTFLWRAAGSPKPKSSVMPFIDISQGAYYYKAVQWAVENGITAGVSSTSFAPEAPCTRGQIVSFLWRTEGSPKVYAANPFADVPANAYYTKAVLWAVKNHITAGLNPTVFSPDSDCTRAQIVSFLYRNK